ncbi:MAG: CHAD domain-containing protein [Simplicispira sp.]|nr:CHAD domain-containing protein [Simplicispira sp.]
MTPPASPGTSLEIEIKLALPTSDPVALLQQLAGVPVLARRKHTRKQVHNLYYDTPAQALRAQRMAVRLRRVDGPTEAQWLQTLKTSGVEEGALSRRGEWETPVPGPALVQPALQAAAPWRRLDPDGAVFAALEPCLSTDFERVVWTVRQRDGSAIEVALDRGQITAGGRTAPICELELELLSGEPAALFALARQIARRVAVVPLAASKAQRGYALREDTLDAPQRACPLPLGDKLPFGEVARGVLAEMFGQFTANLNALCRSDYPELVHQARVGWRRFRSALRLFKPGLAAQALPSWDALAPLLALLGELRDLDVARTHTLPALQPLWMAGEPGRAPAWQAMEQSFAQAALAQRLAVRRALQAPTVGAALLATTEWLETLALPLGADSPAVQGGQAPGTSRKALRHWLRQRMARLHARWKKALGDTTHPQNQHRARILAKRLRYNAEALRPLLPARAQRWQKQAGRLQQNLGATRDVVQAGVLAARLDADRAVVGFLRGFAAGQGALPALPATGDSV